VLTSAGFIGDILLVNARAWWCCAVNIFSWDMTVLILFHVQHQMHYAYQDYITVTNW